MGRGGKPSNIDGVLDSAMNVFRRSRSSRILFTVSSSSPRSAQLDSGIALFAAVSSSTAGAGAVIRLETLSRFLLDARELLEMCKEDVRVGIESVIGFFNGDIRLRTGELSLVCVVPSLGVIGLASPMSELSTALSSLLSVSTRYNRLFSFDGGGVLKVKT